jgi:hypothetical protein
MSRLKIPEFWDQINQPSLYMVTVKIYQENKSKEMKE